MRFNCGPTEAQKAENKHNRLINWHTWFAWFPIRISDSECVWLETIMRKGEPHNDYEGGYYYKWEYSVEPSSSNTTQNPGPQ